MEKKTVLTDDWESDLAAIIEKTNQNLNLLRKIGEKREDAPAKKAMAMMSRAKSSNALGAPRETTGNDRTRASISTDASIHKWKQVLDDSTTLKRHIAHKMLESTKGKDKDKGPRRAASSAWDASSVVNTNQDDRAAHQPLLSLDEIKKSLQVDISSRASLLEKQIADLRTDYQTMTGESGVVSLKLQQLSTQLDAKADRVSSVEHTLQEQSAVLGRLDVQANHVLKWKAAVDVDLQTQTAKTALVDGLENKVVSLERTVAELVTRLTKASDVEQSIEHCTLRISQLEAKAAKSLDNATLTHTIETVVTKAMQAYDDRLTRRLEALTDMQETKNASFLKTIQGQRENYEKAIQYALEASVGDLRNDVDAHTKRIDTRSQEMATSLDLRLTSLAKRVASVESKSSGVETDVDATKNATERDELLKKAVLRHIADTYVTKQQVPTLLVDELEARGTLLAWKRLETAVSKMYREFDQKWHDANKWVDDLKLQVEKTSAGLATMQTSVQKSHITETQALRAKLLQCVNELDQLQSTKLDMDAHFARLEKDRDLQIQKLQALVSEAEAKRDADVHALQSALQSKLLQIASTSGQVEVMKALWKHEQSTLRVCKSDLSSARHEALAYKLKLQSAEKDKARNALDHKQALGRLQDQLARLQKQWQAADRDRATAQSSLHALLQDDARKQAKLATLQGVLQRLQTTASQATASPRELEAAVHEMAAQTSTIHALHANVTELEAAKLALEASLLTSRVSFEAELTALHASHDATLSAREATLTQLSNALASQSTQHAHVCGILTTMAKDVGAATEANDEDAVACAEALQATWAERVQHWETVQALAQTESAATIEALRAQLIDAAAAHESERAALEARVAAHAIELTQLLEAKAQLEASVRTQEDALAQLHQEHHTNGSSLQDQIEVLQDELTLRVNDVEHLRSELVTATEESSALEEELYEVRAKLEAMHDATASEKAELEAKVLALEDAVSTSHAAFASAREEDSIQHSEAMTHLETEIAARDATILMLTTERDALVLAQDTAAEVESRLASLLAEKAATDASLAAWATKEAELVDAVTTAQTTHVTYKAESELELKSLHEALQAQRDATIAIEDDLRRLVTELRLPCAESASPLLATLQSHVAELQAALDDANDERDAIVSALDVSSLEDVPAAAAQLRQTSMNTVQDLAAAEKALSLLRLELDARTADLEATRSSLIRLETSAAGDKDATLAALQATEAQWTVELSQSKAALAPLELEVAAKTCEVEALQSQVAVATAALARCESEMSWLLHEIAVDVEALRGEVDKLEDATEAHTQTLLESQAAHDEQYSAIGHAQDRLEGLQSQLQTLRQQVAAVPMQLYQLQHLQSSLTTEAAAAHKQRDEHEKERLRLRLLEAECAANTEVAFTELAALFAAHGGDATQHTYIMKTMSHLPSLAARLQSVAATIGTMTAHTNDARIHAAGDDALPTPSVADIEAHHDSGDTAHGHGAGATPFHPAGSPEDGNDNDIDEDTIEEHSKDDSSEAQAHDGPASMTADDDAPFDMHGAPNDDDDDVIDDVDDDVQEESSDDDETHGGDNAACTLQPRILVPEASLAAGSAHEDGDEAPHPQHVHSAALMDEAVVDEEEAPEASLCGVEVATGPAPTAGSSNDAEKTEIAGHAVSPELRHDALDAESNAELSDDFDADDNAPETATDSTTNGKATDLAPPPEYEADVVPDAIATEIALEVDHESSSDSEEEYAQAACSSVADRQTTSGVSAGRVQAEVDGHADGTQRSATAVAGLTANDETIDRSGYPSRDDASDDEVPLHRYAATAVPLAVGAAALASLRSSAGFQSTANDADDDDDVERLMQSRLCPALEPVRETDDDDEFSYEPTDALAHNDEDDDAGSTLDEAIEESFDDADYDDEDVEVTQDANVALGTDVNASLVEPPATHGPPSPESPSRRKSIHQLLFGTKPEAVADDVDAKAQVDTPMTYGPAIDAQEESAESEGDDDTHLEDTAVFSPEHTASAAANDDSRTLDEAVANHDALLGVSASPEYAVDAGDALASTNEPEEPDSPTVALTSDANDASEVDEMDEVLSDADESTDDHRSAERSKNAHLRLDLEAEMTNKHRIQQRTDDTPASNERDTTSIAQAVPLDGVDDVQSETGSFDDVDDDDMTINARTAEGQMPAQDEPNDYVEAHKEGHELDDATAVLRATMANVATTDTLDEDVSSSESDADEAPAPSEVLPHASVQPTERSVLQATDGDASDEEEVMAPVFQQSAPTSARATLASLRRAVDSDEDELDDETPRRPTATGDDDDSFDMNDAMAGVAHNGSTATDHVTYESRDVDTLAADNSFDMEYDDDVPEDDFDTAEDHGSSDDEGSTTTPELQPLEVAAAVIAATETFQEAPLAQCASNDEHDTSSLATDHSAPTVAGGDASLPHDVSAAADKVADDEGFSDDEALSENEAMEPQVDEAQEAEHHISATIDVDSKPFADTPLAATTRTVHADVSDDVDEVERLMHSHLHRTTADDSFDADDDDSVAETSQRSPAQESAEMQIGSLATQSTLFSERHDDNGDGSDDDEPLSDPEDDVGDEDDEPLNDSMPLSTHTDVAPLMSETAAMAETKTLELPMTTASVGNDETRETPARGTADVAPLQVTHEYDDAEELSSSDDEDGMDESIEASEDDAIADMAAGALVEPSKAAAPLVFAAQENGAQLAEEADDGEEVAVAVASRFGLPEMHDRDSGSDTEDEPAVDHKDASYGADAAMATALPSAYVASSLAQPRDVSLETDAIERNDEQRNSHADDDHDNAFDLDDEGIDDVDRLADADDEEPVENGSHAVDERAQPLATARFDGDEEVSDDNLETSDDDEDTFDASKHVLEPPLTEARGDDISLASSVVDNGLSDRVSTRHLDNDHELSDADEQELSDDQADTGLDALSSLARDHAAGEEYQLVASVTSLQDDHAMQRATDDDDEALSDPEDDVAENTFDEPTEPMTAVAGIDRGAGAPLTQLHDARAATSVRLSADDEALSDNETDVGADHHETAVLPKSPLVASASHHESTSTTQLHDETEGCQVTETHANTNDENDDSDEALSDVEDGHETLDPRFSDADDASHLGTEALHDTTSTTAPNATATAPMHVGDDCEDALSEEESANDFDSGFDAPTLQSPPVETRMRLHDAPVSPDVTATRDPMVGGSPQMEDDNDDALSEVNHNADEVDDGESSFDAVVAAPSAALDGAERHDTLATDRHDVMRPAVAFQFDDEDEALSDPEDDGEVNDNSFDAPARTPDEPQQSSSEIHADATADRHDVMHPGAQTSTHFDDADEALSDPKDDVDGIDDSFDAPMVTADEPRAPSSESNDNTAKDHQDAMRPVAASPTHFDDEDEALSDAEGDASGIDGTIDAPVSTTDELRVPSTESHNYSTTNRHEAGRPVIQPSTHFDDEDDALSGAEDEVEGVDDTVDDPLATRGEPLGASAESHAAFAATDRHEAVRPGIQMATHFDDADEALSDPEDDIAGIDNSFDAPVVTTDESRTSLTETQDNRATDPYDVMRPMVTSSTHFEDADEALSDPEDEDLSNPEDNGDTIDSSFDAPTMPPHDLRALSTGMTGNALSNGHIIDNRASSPIMESHPIDHDGGDEALSDPEDDSFGDGEHGSNGFSKAPSRPTRAVGNSVDADALSDDESLVDATDILSKQANDAHGHEQHSPDNDHYAPVAASTAMDVGPQEAVSTVPLATSRHHDTSVDDASDADDDNDVSAPLQGADAASIDAASRRLLTTVHYDDADDLSSESDDEQPAAPTKSPPVYDDGGEDVSDSDADDTSAPPAHKPSMVNELAPAASTSAMEDEEDDDHETVETPLSARAPMGGLPPVTARFGTMANAHEADDEDLDEVERLMQGHLQGRANDNSFDFDDGEDIENSFDTPDTIATIPHAHAANDDGENELSDPEDDPAEANVPYHGSLGHDTDRASPVSAASLGSLSVPPPTAQHPTHTSDEHAELDDSDEELSTNGDEPAPRHAPHAAPLSPIVSQLPQGASSLGRLAPLGTKAPLAALHVRDTEDDLDEVERLMRDHVTTHASLASRTAADADFDDSFDAQEASVDDDDNDDALSDPDEAAAAFNAVQQREDTAGKRMPLTPLPKTLPPMSAAHESSLDDASPSKLSALDRALLPSNAAGDARQAPTVHHDDDAMELGASFDDGNEDSLDASGVADPPRFDEGEDVDGSSRDDDAASLSPSPVAPPSSAPPHDDDDAYSDSFDMEESIDESIASDEDATS
ncbi:hypothetical protein, variant [Saprolegnia diclina VS20]|uniref:Uncharacterized protein n=1 Tax=Saprolegnia diclina (strain VS20) TaxID=1156394 RepID=T0SID1_SAPDV|nr:hypothetical protein, variant [Saprolegnia diclina VS20]EQC42667.1 hypothetical protein, variant [Saprolegnia diclina VS20]|eukprot:XP_008604090.1 hypothetical protein, variant [Saprolegnia diclina VS20]